MNQEEDRLWKYAAVIRELIQHENTITNHRLMWMLIVEGILFAGAASFWKIHWAPFVIIAGLGIVTAVSVYHALWLSGRARGHLRKLYEEKMEGHPELIQEIPPVVGDIPGLVTLPWANPWNLIPWAIVVAWILLVISALAFSS